MPAAAGLAQHRGQRSHTGQEERQPRSAGERSPYLGEVNAGAHDGQPVLVHAHGPRRAQPQSAARPRSAASARKRTPSAAGRGCPALPPGKRSPGPCAPAINPELLGCLLWHASADSRRRARPCRGGDPDTQRCTGLGTWPCIAVFGKCPILRSNSKGIVRRATEGTVPVLIRMI